MNQADVKPTRKTRGLIVACTSSTALVSNLVFSNDWCFGALTAMVCGIVVGIGLSVGIDYASPRLAIQPRIMTAVLIGIGLGFAFRLTESRAFEMVFDVERPPGVSEVDVDRVYAGGPGDSVLIMQFRAGESNLLPVLAQGGFEAIPLEYFLPPVDNRSEALDYRLWLRLFGGLLPKNHRWHSLEPPHDLVAYEKNSGWKRTRVVWDREKSVVHVIHSVG